MLSLSEGPSLQHCINHFDTVTADGRPHQESVLIVAGVKKIVSKVGSFIALGLELISWDLHCEKRWYSHDER